MPNLQVKRPVSERIASLHAFSAPHAQFLVDRVFKIGIFDVCPLYGPRGTKLAFRSRISGFGPGLKIAAAQIAITAHRIGMDTFHSRMGQNTVDRTFFTLDTDVGIYLPDHFFRRRFTGQESRQSSDRQTNDRVKALPEKSPPGQPVFFRAFFH
jgi:hypothetical protein